MISDTKTIIKNITHLKKFQENLKISGGESNDAVTGGTDFPPKKGNRSDIIKLNACT